MKRDWKIRQIDSEKTPKGDRAMLARHGTDYVDFYEERQDSIMRRDPATFEKVNRVWQFEFLQRHGLKTSDRFLDYGCGPAAAGIYFIEFLEPGRWVGVDISNESIRLGHELIARKNLTSRGAELFYIPGGDLAPIAGRKFDVILAQSVFTHLPPDDIIAILQRLGALMEADSSFYGSFSCTEGGIIQQQLHNWYYDHDFIRTAAGDAKMNVDLLPDWEHPYQSTQPSFSRSTMARFRLA